MGGSVTHGQRGQDTSIALLERLLLVNFASTDGLTRAQLEELSGLSRTVVAGVVAALVERGDLVEMRPSPAPGVRGRPPARYQRPALLAPVLLIRMAKGTATSASLVSADGTTSETLTCAPWSLDWEDWSRSVADAAKRLSGRSQLQPRAAVLSMPFPVAEGHGAPPLYTVPQQVLAMTGKRMPPHPPWLDGDPRTRLGYLLGCPVLPVNYANLAALGEARFGAGRGYRAVVHVSVVNGVGAGFVLEGRLFTGAHGFAGELAHVQITPDGYPCVCGNRGCLRTEPSVLPQLGIVNGTVRAPAGNPGHLAPGTAWQAVSAPDYLTGLGGLIGHALAPLMTALDPDCLVVDAGLGESVEHFIAGLTQELKRRCPPPLTEWLTVVPGGLPDAARSGALALADAHLLTIDLSGAGALGVYA